MKRRIVLLTAAVVAVAETYRRGYGAVVLFGCRRWAVTLDPRPTPTSEPDYLA